MVHEGKRLRSHSPILEFRDPSTDLEICSTGQQSRGDATESEYELRKLATHGFSSPSLDPQHGRR